MQTLENKAGLSLAMSVWLAHDEYTNGQEEHPGENVISATALLKPIRQLVLAPRVPPSERPGDVSDNIPSKFGHAIHSDIENAWKHGYRASMQRLGYPAKMIDKVRINPADDELSADIIPVYLEGRHFRKITVDGREIVISGQFDQILNGELNDTKTTSVYAFINRSKEDDYRIQGSIYRWINPTRVTSDVMRIQHVFTDWQSAQVKANPSYPASRLIEFQVDLMSLEDTEKWIVSRIRHILANQDLPEPEIVRCTDKELWKSDPQFKYYSDPAKAVSGGRSSKNFPNYPAAAAHCSKQGKGVVITVPGRVKACSYCPAFPVCSQKDEYDHGDT